MQIQILNIGNHLKIHIPCNFPDISFDIHEVSAHGCSLLFWIKTNLYPEVGKVNKHESKRMGFTGFASGAMKRLNAHKIIVNPWSKGPHPIITISLSIIQSAFPIKDKLVKLMIK